MKSKVTLMPVVDFNKCEGIGDCVVACPHDVFEISIIKEDDKLRLNFLGRMKTYFRKRKAYVVRGDQCASCGLCVKACPEHAIRLFKK